MNDKIKIKLLIADSYYPLTIKPEDEEMVREAAKRVNDRIKDYRKLYPNQDPKEIISMVAYGFSLYALKIKDRNDTEPYTEKIKELTGVLEDYFRQE